MTDEIRTLADEIYDFIGKRVGTSFVEIERKFDIEKTKDTPIYPLFTSPDSNIVLWMFAKKEIIDAFVYLASNEKLIFYFGDKVFLCYLMDGAMLKLPIAKKQNMKYKSLRWLPATMNTDRFGLNK